MRYIKVEPSTLKVSVTSRPGKSELTIPVTDQRANQWQSRHRVSDAILYDVIYPARYAENRRRGIKAKYSLHLPDPWLVAIGLVMWEGIVQGLSWEMVKVSVQAALGKLQRARLAPMHNVTSEKSATELGFRYTSYLRGEKQRELFMGLRRSHAKEAVSKKAANSAVHRTRAKAARAGDRER
jgi:hypothetical protein